MENENSNTTGTHTVELPPAPPSPAEIELEKAKQRIKELEEAQAAKDEALSQSRIDVAAAQAKRGATKLGNAVSDLQLQRAIAEAGGPALWSTLNPSQQAKSLGLEGSEQVKDSEVKKFFGRGSDARAANALAKQDPARYAQLRKLAKVRGIY